MKRKICVFSSTRADYGHLRNLIKEINSCIELDLQLLISGTHLVPEQGLTIEEIRGDGYEPDKCIDIELTEDSPEGICHSMGIAISRYGQYLSENSPDLIVILGDRFEAFCCASAAQICRIPIAHIHGGEITEGAVDEAFRHSITKMSHIHFPCCDEYRNRIIQMGELPEYVYNVGALGVENIRKLNFMSKDELEVSIGFKIDKPFFLITFHPVTLEKKTSGEQFDELLSALDHYSDHKLIITHANADTDGKIINKKLNDYAKLYPDRCFVAPSLGFIRYVSAMELCEAVIGNSSSGILEAPVLRVPTINIGDRQKGRIRAESIIDCYPTKKSILSALQLASTESFKKKLENMEIPFEKKGTAIKIKNIIMSIELKEIQKKKFYDF